MKIKELKVILNAGHQHDEDEVKVRLTSPSVGSLATVKIVGAAFGFDWDSGDFILEPERSIVEKSRNEAIFDLAHDLLMYIATKPGKGNTFEIRSAKRILLSAGYKEEDFAKFRHLYHKV